MKPLYYRKDIDGLRAIAVLAVVIFHIFPTLLPGGFVGVDIFFVISGYLISSIITDGLNDRSFTISGFYVARIRRIFPALIIVLASVSFFGWFALLNSEYQQLGKHIAAGSGFISNIILWSESGYFDTDSVRKPLLHLWSLGIEEQFYLLWPMIMWFAYRRKISVVKTTVFITIISFAINIVAIAIDPIGAFYLPVSRMWELAIGGLLSFFREQLSTIFQYNSAMEKITSHVRPLIGGNTLCWCGFILLIAAMFLFNGAMLYPGWWAFVPVLGTVAFIAAGPEAWLNKKILSNSVGVFVGLISYPLYLWHWPFLSFLNIILPKENMGSKCIALLLSFCLAGITYWFIEKPVRKKAAKPIVLICVMIFLCVLGCLCWSGIIKPRFASFGFEKILTSSAQIDFPGNHLQPFRFNGKIFYHQGGDITNALFIGDSNIEQYYPRIDKLLVQHPENMRGVVFASSAGCVPIPQVMESNRRHWCFEFIKDAFEYAKNNEKIDSVVIAANWYLYFSNADPIFDYSFVSNDSLNVLGVHSLGTSQSYDMLQHTISDLSHQGKKVYLILNIPTGEELDPLNVVKRSLLHGFQIQNPNFNKENFVSMINPVMDELKKSAVSGGAVIINPIDFLCDKYNCPALASDGYPIYRDKSHLASEFVKDHIMFLDNIILNQ